MHNQTRTHHYHQYPNHPYPPTNPPTQHTYHPPHHHHYPPHHPPLHTVDNRNYPHPPLQSSIKLVNQPVIQGTQPQFRRQQGNTLQKVEGRNYYIINSQENHKERLSEAEFSEKKQPMMGKEEDKTKPTKKKIRNQSKYNLYSMLDQPFERVKKSGCSAMKCPANECIASEDKYPWL